MYALLADSRKLHLFSPPAGQAGGKAPMNPRVISGTPYRNRTCLRRGWKPVARH